MHASIIDILNIIKPKHFNHVRYCQSLFSTVLGPTCDRQLIHGCSVNNFKL